MVAGEEGRGNDDVRVCEHDQLIKEVRKSYFMASWQGEVHEQCEEPIDQDSRPLCPRIEDLMVT